MADQPAKPATLLDFTRLLPLELAHLTPPGTTPPPTPRALGPLPAEGQPLTIALPGVEIAPGFDKDGVSTGMVYDRSEVMSPEKSGVYGQSGQLFLTRPRAGPAGDTLYAVAVRSRAKKVWPGGLDYTASGMSDVGETELDTIVRETREALGFEPRRADLQCIASWVPRDGFWSRGALYTMSWGSADVPFNPADTEEIRWMSAVELLAAARRDVPMKSDMRRFLLSRLWPPTPASAPAPPQ